MKEVELGRPLPDTGSQFDCCVYFYLTFLIVTCKRFIWQENNDVHLLSPQTQVRGQIGEEAQGEGGVVQWGEHCTGSQRSGWGPSFANAVLGYVTPSQLLHHLRSQLSLFTMQQLD